MSTETKETDEQPRMNYGLLVCKLCGEEIVYYSCGDYSFYGCPFCAVGIRYGFGETYSDGKSASDAFRKFITDKTRKG